MRSFLFVPGDAPDKMQKALNCGADAVILDLEDSVSQSNKTRAREETAAFLKETKRDKDAPLIVRINPLSAPGKLADHDLEAIMPQAPDAILLPKAQGGADVQWLGAKLATLEALNNLPLDSTQIIALAPETPAAVFTMGSYQEASRRLIALTWGGGEDLSTAVGAATNRETSGELTEPYRLVRNLTLFAAAAANIPAIDGIYPNFSDTDGARREALLACRDGFSGKLAIHPSQVPIFNEAFTPSTHEVAQAQDIIAAFKDAGESAGTIGLKGYMLDRPHLARAERIIRRARSAGLVR